ncbi:iron-hydroxamate ABC transporter substrate-binding protein [Ornithinibacillus scapharcae]|uniref:iron-hydroxamate ABC transporter substrate-binding protein n=1 Tax=Ornithinibacillus scapharcae TaxID=1147159 RepID=UPI000225BD18|nr:iron-hydroxamate ABC transporter substrate-binding protein [Ornithinibacillus scapharcae]
MKKLLVYMIPILFVFILSACGKESSNTDHDHKSEPNETNTAEESSSDTIIYESENGPVEVPANPERVIVLGSYAGNVMALGVNLVGVDAWAKMNPEFEEELKGVEQVTDEDLEKIIELEPDLIIGLSNTKNIDKLKEIAPTVTYTYNNVDYLTQHIEIGKLLNKEDEAVKWVEDFRERARAAGDEIRAKIGEDATVTVIEGYDKQIYIYGDSWGRGTEILYQEMGLKMPEKVKETALEPGYNAISPEVLPEYIGDYVVVSKFADQENAFLETETYQNIPAVKNGNVIEADANAIFFNDALTLEYQLEIFEDAFLEK